MIYFLTYLFMFLVGHALADYAFQSQYVSQAKNRNDPLGANGVWKWVLSWHALIHAAMVFAIVVIPTTAFILLNGYDVHIKNFLFVGLALSTVEFVSHWIIDYRKCQNHFNFHVDQWSHIGFKIFYALFFGVVCWSWGI